MPNWIKYAQWEESQNEFDRQVLHVDVSHILSDNARWRGWEQWIGAHIKGRGCNPQLFKYRRKSVIQNCEKSWFPVLSHWTIIIYLLIQRETVGFVLPCLTTVSRGAQNSLFLEVSVNNREDMFSIWTCQLPRMRTSISLSKAQNHKNLKNFRAVFFSIFVFFCFTFLQ